MSWSDVGWIGVGYVLCFATIALAWYTGEYLARSRRSGEEYEKRRAELAEKRLTAASRADDAMGAP